MLVCGPPCQGFTMAGKERRSRAARRQGRSQNRDQDILDRIYKEKAQEKMLRPKQLEDYDW